MPARGGVTAMENRLSEFIEGLKAQDLGALKQHLRGALGDLGFDWFGYVGMNLPNVAVKPGIHANIIPHITINVAPSQWVERYAEQNYYGDDPVMLESLRTIIPFRWSDAVRRKRMSSIGRQVMEEATECGLHTGLTVPVLGHGGKFGLLSVSSKETLKDLNNPLANIVHTVHVMSIYFHAAVQEHLAGLKPLPQETALRPREIECLLWTARGKTAWEISMILKVSERTVTFHLGNAMRKLGVYNKTHAVAKMIATDIAQP